MSRRYDRRQFLHTSARYSLGALAAGAIPGALAACGGGGSESDAAGGGGTTSSSGPATKVGYQMTWVLDSEFGGEYVAVDRGYYKDENLDVTILAGGPNVAAEPLVVSKKAFAALSEPEYVAAAVAQGAPLKIVAAHFQRIPWAIMSLASAPIKTPDDMRGKRIGVPALDEVAWKAFLTLNKIDPGEVTKVRVQFDPTPLVEHEVDGWLAYAPNEPVNLKVQGIDTHIFLFEDYGYHEVADVVIVHQDTLADDDARENLVGLLRGDIKGWQDFRDDPAAGAKLAVTRFGKSLDLKMPIETAKSKAYVAFVESDDTKANGLFWMSDEAIDKTIHTMGVSGIKSNRDLFDTSVLEDVYGGKTSL